ncbi:MAG: hypothetical protein AAGG48_28995 [Planctomycetota bacterium]
MSKTNQGSKRRLASIVATLAVLGYIGSYGPSVFSWWEETWYPHGREPRVIAPAPESEFYVQHPAEAAWQEENNRSNQAGNKYRSWPTRMPEALSIPPLVISEPDQLGNETGV